MIPVEVVYDRNKVFISNENSEELMLPSQSNTLGEMAWLNQMYNIMIMGPSGVGETRMPADWARMLDDEVLATAILDPYSSAVK